MAVAFARLTSALKCRQFLAASHQLVMRMNCSNKSNMFGFGSPAPEPANFKSVEYFVKNRVAHIRLNRPERMNAIDYHMLTELGASVESANFDDDVKIILLYGNKTFCSGYDLKLFAESPRGKREINQEMPWDPYVDYKFMGKLTDCIMSLWRSPKPVICKVNGVAIGGGSDIALTGDITFMADSALIGYPPSRVWGCPTTAMWVYRVGMEKAKRILFTGNLLSGQDAEKMGLIGEAVPEDQLDEVVDDFIQRIITVPNNQLFFQKQVINNAIEMMGLGTSQRLAILFDGMSRNTPEGVAFQQTAHKYGFKKAIADRDAPEHSDKKTDE